MTEVEFLGKVALVTGSTGDGMGRAIALTLAREGSDVALNYGTGRPGNRKAATQIATEIRRTGRRCVVVPADTRNASQVRRMFRETEKALGRVDILVNNAGGDWRVSDYSKISPDHWRSVLQAEIDGAFFCLQAALPGMRRGGYGRVVNISMVVPDNWKNLAQDYTLGKAARTTMMRGFYRRELRHGITMNTVSPGPIAGNPWRQALELRDHGPAWRGRRAPGTQDIAEIVRFLCSDAARFVSGTEVLVPSWAWVR